MINCPICHKQIKETITKKLRDGSNQDIFYCKKCELGILDDKRSEKKLKEFYASKYRRIGKPKITGQSSPKELFDIYSRFQEERLELLHPYFSKKKRLLEIGCSSGMFLYHVKKYVGEIVGIDYDIASAKYASKKCRCKVYTEDIENTDIKKNSFDIICVFQVLEHIKNPEDFLKKIKKYLKPNGIIAIEVPNLHDSLVYVYDLPYHRQFFFHSAHLWYFTEKSLKRMMSKASFKGRIFHIQDYNIMNHMNWIIKDKPDKDCIAGLSSPTFPIRKDTPPHISRGLNNFIKKMDREYKQELSKLKITLKIMFIGKK